jgi:hypothetical protein
MDVPQLSEETMMIELESAFRDLGLSCREHSVRLSEELAPHLSDNQLDFTLNQLFLFSHSICC